MGVTIAILASLVATANGAAPPPALKLVASYPLEIGDLLQVDLAALNPQVLPAPLEVEVRVRLPDGSSAASKLTLQSPQARCHPIDPAVGGPAQATNCIAPPFDHAVVRFQAPGGERLVPAVGHYRFTAKLAGSPKPIEPLDVQVTANPLTALLPRAGGGTYAYVDGRITAGRASRWRGTGR